MGAESWRRSAKAHQSAASAVHGIRFLDDYRGRFSQCDGYDTYAKLGALERPEDAWQLVYCWTHVRQRLVKRLETDGAPIGFYATEKSVRGGASGLGLAARRERAAPIVAAFRPWLEARLSRIPGSSKPGEDIRYTLGLRPRLVRFLNDGRLELETTPSRTRSSRSP